MPTNSSPSSLAAVPSHDQPPTLALSGGGARGAYEAGAVHALAEAGLRFPLVAGASIGAINAAYYAQGDGSPEHTARMADVWRSLAATRVLEMNKVGAAKWLAILPALLMSRGVAIGALMKAVHSAPLLSTKPVEAVLAEHIDFALVGRGDIDIHVAALAAATPIADVVAAPWRAMTFFRLRDLAPDQARNAVLASAAIPLAFPPREVNGTLYVDAAYVLGPPAQHLYDLGSRRICSVFLTDNSVQNRDDLPGATLFQVRPSTNIDLGLGSTFDFSPDTVERLVDLGYHDAQRQIKQGREWVDALLSLRRGGDALEESTGRLTPRAPRTFGGPPDA